MIIAAPSAGRVEQSRLALKPHARPIAWFCRRPPFRAASPYHPGRPTAAPAQARGPWRCGGCKAYPKTSQRTIARMAATAAMIRVTTSVAIQTKPRGPSVRFPKAKLKRGANASILFHTCFALHDGDVLTVHDCLFQRLESQWLDLV